MILHVSVYLQIEHHHARLLANVAELSSARCSSALKRASIREAHKFLESKFFYINYVIMSARFYPRYVLGNPQLRIFLPDWKMILVKPTEKTPNNIVTFKVDPRMTDWDIRNYLEKIYKVSVGAVYSRIHPGELYKTRKGVSKLEDYKIVRVMLPLGQTFDFPDITGKDKQDEKMKDYQELEKAVTKDRGRGIVQDVPKWFLS